MSLFYQQHKYLHFHKDSLPSYPTAAGAAPVDFQPKTALPGGALPKLAMYTPN